MIDDPILVLGATGGQGGAVTAALLARDAPVRALVRDADSAGARRLAARDVEVVAGALGDRDSLTAAMRDVRAVFALTTPFEKGIDAEVAQGRAIVAAAHEARTPHLVFSSVAGADIDSAVPHFRSKARIEAELTGGQVPYTILSPTYFFDNALGDAAGIRNGVLRLPLPADRSLQQLARPDLGAFAATVLLAPATFVGRRIELAGDPTPTRMAAALGEVLGRDVHHQQTPIDSIDNADMQAMWRFLNGPGYQVDLPALHAEHPGVDWTSFDVWARSTFRSAK
jgi:uncharacterized protein YbjT (DUF2867 family)